MTAVAKTLFKDHKSKAEIMSAIADVQLSANTVARRVSLLASDVIEQLERFSLQCDESVDLSDTAQLAVFIRMFFVDFSSKEEFLTLLPLKTTTRGVDIYNVFKTYRVEKRVPLEKLVSMTTDGAPAMIGRHSGFIAHCNNDPDFPAFLNYHCIIHQQAICSKVMRFDHVMTPVVKIINSICAKSKQHRCFKVFLDELSAEYGDLLFHTEVRWLSRGNVLHRFISLLSEIKAFMEARGEDTNLLSDAGWLLDLAFLADVTEKLNQLNLQLQVLKMLESHADTPEVFDVHKYCDLLSRLGQEFEGRFSDFEKLEPCVAFIANPFTEMDIDNISKQIAELFNLREPVGAALASLKTDITPPTALEYEAVRDALDVLGPFRQATVELSGEKRVSASKVIPLMKMLNHAVTSKLEGLNSNLTKQLSDSLVRRFWSPICFHQTHPQLSCQPLQKQVNLQTTVTFGIYWIARLITVEGAQVQKQMLL
ncbi:unnamed protein product [Leuciscus chuanchicus]